MELKISCWLTMTFNEGMCFFVGVFPSAVSVRTLLMDATLVVTCLPPLLPGLSLPTSPPHPAGSPLPPLFPSPRPLTPTAPEGRVDITSNFPSPLTLRRWHGVAKGIAAAKQPSSPLLPLPLPRLLAPAPLLPLRPWLLPSLKGHWKKNRWSALRPLHLDPQPKRLVYNMPFLLVV